MFDGHFAGCATFAITQEIERRRQQQQEDVIRMMNQQNEIMMRIVNPPAIMSSLMPDEYIAPGQSVVLRTGLPRVEWSRMDNPDSFEAFDLAPRTSADGPSAFRSSSHTVSSAPTVHGGNTLMCSCGWVVPANYLEGMPEREVVQMIDAHIAGGQVGPQPKKFEFFGKEVLPRQVWETPEISEPAMMPRRHFNLELEN